MIESLRDEIDRLELLYAAHPDGRIFSHLAEAYRRVGDLPKARETVEQGLRRHPDYSSAHVVFGRILLDGGDRSGAHDAFRRVLELDPENRIALRALADLLREDDRSTEAVTFYRELLLIDPSDTEVEELLREIEAQAATGASTDPDSTPPAPDAERATVEVATTDSAAPPPVTAGESDAQDLDRHESPDTDFANDFGGALPPSIARGGFVWPGDPPPEQEQRDAATPAESAAAPDDEPSVAMTGNRRPDTANDRQRAAAGDSHDSTEFAPVVTETMAELYAGQGLYTRAADVYRELLSERPADERLQARLRKMESLAAFGVAEATSQRPAIDDPEPAPASGPRGDDEEPDPLVASDTGRDAADPYAAGAAPFLTHGESPEPWGTAAAHPPLPRTRWIRAYFTALLAYVPPADSARWREPIDAAAPHADRDTPDPVVETHAAPPRAGAVDPTPVDDVPATAVEARVAAPAPAVSPARGEPFEDAASSASEPATTATTAAAYGALAVPADPDSSNIALIDLLVGLLEYRDPFFRGGSSLTRLFATAIGREMDLDRNQLSTLALAAVLRDLGRLALGGRLIKKPRVDLGPDARRRIEDHVDLALQLLEGVELPPGVQQAIRHHHERWDGAGYPDGLSRERIPLTARILAVADSLSAMISPRPYRLPRRINAAIEELRDEAGTRYDPAVVDAMVRTLPGGDRWTHAFGLRHHTIIVHPDQPRATVLAAKLCSFGYIAEAAEDLVTARDRMKRIRVELWVLSANLPEDGTVELLRELRETDASTAVPVVVVDADAVERRVALLEQGADICFPPGISFIEFQATLNALMKRATRTPADTGPDNSGDGGSAWYALQGDVQDFPLAWLLQVLAYDGRTAAISMRDRFNDGMIYLENGTARHARSRDLTGEDALRRMLRWPTGSFVVRPDVRTDEQTIDRPLMHILLDQAVANDHDSSIFGAVRAD